MTLIVIYFFSLIKVVERVVTEIVKEDSDLILESMLFVTESLITGTHYQQVALIVMLLTLLRSISLFSGLNWNRGLYSFKVVI